MRRRDFLKATAAAAGAAAIGQQRPWLRGARAQSAGEPEKFLFVITAVGGANMLDGLFPILPSEVTGSGDPSTLSVYTEQQIAQPTGSNFRVVRDQGYKAPFSADYELETLVRRHHQDMTLVTVENTSVNHTVAQKRSITGAEIDGGRTIQEAVAMRWGMNKLIPNCTMSVGGYIEPGTNPIVPDAARAEIIKSPHLFALSTDGSRGIAGAPAQELVERARAMRERLEGVSPFGQRHESSGLRRRILELRTQLRPRIADADLITKLMLIPDAATHPDVPGAIALAEHDVMASPDGARLLEAFPNLMIDNMESQTALAFLLARHGVTSTVTLGPSDRPVFYDDGTILGTPIGFDYSHVNHPQGQNIMWNRLAKMIDGLITLLKAEPYGDGSMWDRSLIYLATDFGRDRKRPKDAKTWGTAHELNNANLFISPMLKGNRMFGGIDTETLKFHGFDRATGEPAPGTLMREGDLYSLVATAMDAEFAGRTDMSAVLR